MTFESPLKSLRFFPNFAATYGLLNADDSISPMKPEHDDSRTKLNKISWLSAENEHSNKVKSIPS